MESSAGSDWRSEAPYRALIGCDAALFAWEWLRRDPDYRRAATRRDANPERFGLHLFEDPDRHAASARIWWCADTDPTVLAATAEPCPHPRAFDPARLARLMSIVTDADGVEHVLLADGRHTLRVDIIAGTLRQGPVRLAWRLSGLEEALAPTTTLRRLVDLYRTGFFSNAGQLSAAKARRWALLLRVRDALAEGASQRAIAAALFGEASLGARWRVDAPAYRLRVQRLVQAARRMARHDSAMLLRVLDRRRACSATTLCWSEPPSS